MGRKEEIKERLAKRRPTRVFSYIHGEGRIGVLLEIESDTDFALKNELMESFAKEVMLQIASMNPAAVSVADCECRAAVRNSNAGRLQRGAVVFEPAGTRSQRDGRHPAKERHFFVQTRGR